MLHFKTTITVTFVAALSAGVLRHIFLEQEPLPSIPVIGSNKFPPTPSSSHPPLIVKEQLHNVTTTTTIYVAPETVDQAESYFLAGRYQEASILTRKLIFLSVDYGEAIPVEVFQLFRSICSAQERLSEYSAFLASLPNYYTLKRDLLADHGAYLVTQGKYAEAETQFLQALQIFPGDIYIMEQYGSAMASEYRWEEAIKMYRQLSQLDPSEEAIDNYERIILMYKNKDIVDQ